MNTLGNNGTDILKMDVFGSRRVFERFREWIIKACEKIDWPILFVTGDQVEGNGIGGIQTHQISGCPLEPIKIEGRSVGRVYEDDIARYCVLGNLYDANPEHTRPEQTRRTLELMEQALEHGGLRMNDIVRTWFFNDRILDWYGTFNEVRTRFYTEKAIFNGLVPASTGMGGGNPYGRALLAAAIAISPKNEEIRIEEIPSPLQCSARDYGSSFSRAVEVVTPSLRRIFVSGTASIDGEGRTVHTGRMESQVDHTFDVVEAILESREMTFNAVTRAVAYVKNAEDVPVFVDRIHRRTFPVSRMITIVNDICRDDLLFEIELDAIIEEAQAR